MAPQPIPASPGAGAGEQLGIGVLGLHEGLTLLKAVAWPVPREPATHPGDAGRMRAPHVRPVAGCDLSEDKIAAARAEIPGLFYTTSYDAMLGRGDVHIVCIYTPDPLHGEHIIRAFEAGKHVICTKPLVNSLDAARDVLAAGRRTGRKLLVGQSTRFFEPFARQRKAFERGEVGALEFLDTHYIHRMDWYYDRSPWAADATDWAFLCLSHPVDLARWYLGRIDDVHAFGARSALAQGCGARSFDIYTVNLRSAAGPIGRVMGHYGLRDLPSARNAIELMLFGSAGTSLAQYHDMRYVHTSLDGEVIEDPLYARRSYYFNNEAHGMHYGEFANYAEYFAQALLNGRAYSPDLDEGIETICVMEAIRRSALAGRAVRLAPLLEEVGL
jgi:predicted dehydrogenase